MLFDTFQYVMEHRTQMLRHAIKSQVIGMGMVNSAGIRVLVTEHAAAIEIVQIRIALSPATDAGFHDDPVRQNKVPLCGLGLSQTGSAGAAHDQNGSVRQVLPQPCVERIMLAAECLNAGITQLQIQNDGAQIQ